MSLPERIVAKISSEAAGYISITPVQRQELSLAELVERILALTGKDAARVRGILSRGTFVSGASRYRWEPLAAEENEVRNFLGRFPDPEPGRPFMAAQCRQVVLRGRRGILELPYEVASRRKTLKRRSFWDVLIPVLEAHSPYYDRYCYAQQADVYAAKLTLEAVRTLHANANLLSYSTVAQQLRRLEADSAELFVQR